MFPRELEICFLIVPVFLSKLCSSISDLPLDRVESPRELSPVGDPRLLRPTLFIQLNPMESAYFNEDDDHAEFDGDGKPGTQEQFKIEVGAGREECFFQKMTNGSHLHTSFQVLRGADRNINVIMRNPEGSVIAENLWTTRGTIEKYIEKQGVHALCLSNTMSRFTSKLVDVYFLTQDPQQWDEYAKTQKEYDSEIKLVLESIHTTMLRLVDIRKLQARSRMHYTTDSYTVKKSKQHVHVWSIAMCLFIVSVSGFQVYFIRNLFKLKISATSTKVRA